MTEPYRSKTHVPSSKTKIKRIVALQKAAKKKGAK
jgi:hypothetical protein